MTLSPNIGSKAAVQTGFPEFIPPPSPSGLSAAGLVPDAADYPDIVTDGDAGTLAALESALSLSVYRIKYVNAAGESVYLVLFK